MSELNCPRNNDRKYKGVMEDRHHRGRSQKLDCYLIDPLMTPRHDKVGCNGMAIPLSTRQIVTSNWKSVTCRGKIFYYYLLPALPAVFHFRTT